MTANTTRNAAPQPPAPTTAAPVPKPAPYAPIGRIPVTEVFPVVEDGRWPAKAVPGEAIPIRATVFREGHDCFGATAVLVCSDGTDGLSARMVEVLPGLDRYEARLALLPGFTGPPRRGNHSGGHSEEVGRRPASTTRRPCPLQ